MSSLSSEVYYPMRFQTFGAAFGALVVFWLIAEVVFGFWRSPVADRWVGEVYLEDSVKRTHTPIDAKLDLDIVNLGNVFDRRPVGNSGSGYHISFSGKDVETLRKIGVPARFIAEKGENYERSFCSIKEYTSFPSKIEKLTFGVVGDSQFTGHCPDSIIDFYEPEFGVPRFDSMRFTLGFAGKYNVFAKLRRETHISFIQRYIMKTFKEGV